MKASLYPLGAPHGALPCGGDLLSQELPLNGLQPHLPHQLPTNDLAKNRSAPRFSLDFRLLLYYSLCRLTTRLPARDCRSGRYRQLALSLSHRCNSQGQIATEETSPLLLRLAHHLPLPRSTALQRTASRRAPPIESSGYALPCRNSEKSPLYFQQLTNSISRNPCVSNRLRIPRGRGGTPCLPFDTFSAVRAGQSFRTAGLS